MELPPLPLQRSKGPETASIVEFKLSSLRQRRSPGPSGRPGAESNSSVRGLSIENSDNIEN